MIHIFLCSITQILTTNQLSVAVSAALCSYFRVYRGHLSNPILFKEKTAETKEALDSGHALS